MAARYVSASMPSAQAIRSEALRIALANDILIKLGAALGRI